MAVNHGYDATGQNIVILNIAKHRKDSKKAPMLRKWIAFSYEMHVSGENMWDSHMTVIFITTAKRVSEQQNVHGF